MSKRILCICIIAGLVLLLSLSSCSNTIPADFAFYETASAMYWERDGSHMILKQKDLMTNARLIIEGTVSEVHHYTLAYTDEGNKKGVYNVNYYTIYTIDIDEFIVNEDNYKDETIKIVTMHLGKPEQSGNFLLAEGRSYIIITEPFGVFSYSRPDINKLFDSYYETGTGQMVFPIEDDETVIATRTVLFNTTPHEDAPENTVSYKDGGVPIIQRNKSEFYIEKYKVDKESFITHLKKLHEKLGAIATE